MAAWQNAYRLKKKSELMEGNGNGEGDICDEDGGSECEWVVIMGWFGGGRYLFLEVGGDWRGSMGEWVVIMGWFGG